MLFRSAPGLGQGHRRRAPPPAHYRRQCRARIEYPGQAGKVADVLAFLRQWPWPRAFSAWNCWVRISIEKQRGIKMKERLKGSEVPEHLTWNLAHIFANEEVRS